MLNNIKEFKKYLKTLHKDYIDKLLKTAELNDIEYSLANKSLILKQKVNKTCMELNISRSQYFVVKNKMLIKLYYTLKNLY